MFRFLTVIFTLKLFVSLTLGDEDEVFLGCYKKTSDKTFSDKHSGMENFWDFCFSRICENFDFVGINARECYCGNEITSIFVPVDDADCETCFSDRTRYCGGPNTLSLYKRIPPKASETAVLLTTNNSIKIWAHENCIIQYSRFSLSNDFITHMNYCPYQNSDQIFYVSRKEISHISNFKYKHSWWLESGHLIKTNCDDVVDLAIDWLNFTIFWGCRATGGIYQKSETSNINFLFHLGDIQNIAIDQYRKFMILSNVTGLAKYDLNFSKTDILNTHNFTYLLHVALDIQQERMYLICSYGEESGNYLVTTDYNATIFTVVLSGEDLSNPFGLDAVNGTVVWGNKNENYTLYKAQVSSTHCAVNVTALFSLSEKINDFKMYTYEARKPSTKYLCEKKNCSHECVRLSVTEVECLCLPNMVIDEDGRSCIGLPTTTASSSPKTLMSTTASDQASTIDRHSATHSPNVVMTTKDCTDVSKKLESFQRFVYTFITGSFMVTMVLIINLIYQAVNLHQIKRKLSKVGRDQIELQNTETDEMSYVALTNNIL